MTTAVAGKGRNVSLIGIGSTSTLHLPARLYPQFYIPYEYNCLHRFSHGDRIYVYIFIFFRRRLIWYTHSGERIAIAIALCHKENLRLYRTGILKHQTHTTYNNNNNNILLFYTRRSMLSYILLSACTDQAIIHRIVVSRNVDGIAFALTFMCLLPICRFLSSTLKVIDIHKYCN